MIQKGHNEFTLRTNRVSENELNGPAIAVEIGEIDFMYFNGSPKTDLVISIYCPAWPPEATE